MRKAFILFLLVLSCHRASFAQDTIEEFIDSMLRVEQKLPDDTAKVNALVIISQLFSEIVEIDSTLIYAQRAVTLSENLKDKKARMYAYSQLGFAYSTLTKYDTAISFFDKAISGFKKLKDSVGLGESFSNKGMAYDYMGKNALALENYFEALKIHRALGDIESEMSNLMNIGNVYGTVGEREKSMEYYYKAIEINKELGFEYDEALIYINIAVEFATAEEYDSALYFNKKAIALLEDLEDDLLVAHTVENNGGIYLEQKKYNDALRELNKSGKVFDSIGDKRYVVTNLHAKGTTFLSVATDTVGFKADKTLFSANKSSNLKTAIKYLEASKAIYDGGEIEDIVEMSELYGDLYQAYEAKGDIEKAYSYYKEYNVLVDSILAQEDDKKIAQLEGQMALDVKNKELELQKLLVAKKRNERGFLIAGIALLVIVIGIVFYNYRQRGITNKLLAEEKHKSEDLLHNILPEEVASELKDRGATTAQHFDRVTVLFTDFVGFTKAGERMTSQELVDELHACFKAFDEITGKYDIEKIKTIGDAYLAVCGLPVTDQHHAEKCVNAAIDILHFMKDRREKLGDKTFEIRIGVHSGDVVAGIVGVKKFAYDIWGDTVNTAARMESKSEPGKINISQTTYELVQDKFACNYRGELEAKNKGKLKMYFIEA